MTKKKAAAKPAARQHQATPIETSDPSHYEGKQHYPKMLYHKDKPAEGRIVKDAAEEALLRKEKGWAENPRDHGHETSPGAVDERPGVAAEHKGN